MAYTKAGIRFSPDIYVLVDAEGSAGVERKELYVNPDTSVEMTGDVLFQESEIEGYDFLAFVVTDTSESYEVEEWCEIAPLKSHGGQFIISMPTSGALYCRKVYRSAGAVKPSTGVFDIGKTTGDKNFCIIKSVDAVKLNKGE